MKILIEMSNEDYETIINKGALGVHDRAYSLCDSIFNGKILPEKHSKSKVDQIVKQINEIQITDYVIDMKTYIVHKRPNKITVSEKKKRRIIQ